MAIQRHFGLKLLLLETFGSQRAAARKLKIREDALSRIVNGKENLSAGRSREKLQASLR